MTLILPGFKPVPASHDDIPACSKNAQTARTPWAWLRSNEIHASYPTSYPTFSCRQRRHAGRRQRQDNHSCRLDHKLARSKYTSNLHMETQAQGRIDPGILHHIQNRQMCGICVILRICRPALRVLHFRAGRFSSGRWFSKAWQTPFARPFPGLGAVFRYNGLGLRA